MAKFNERLRLLRMEYHLSQQDLAKQIGTSKSSINMYERGEREPGIEMLEEIADYFNVDMNYLFGKTDHRSKPAWLAKNIDDNKITIGKRIKNCRISLNMTQDELAKILGYRSRSSINKIELDQRNLTQSKIKAIAEALETTPSYIMGWEDNNELNLFPGTMPISTQRIPMLGEIACGKPIICNEDRERYVEAGTNIHADFCLRCKGDSMTGARIFDGDIVFIRSQDTVDNGQIAAVIIDNEATLKRVYYYPEKAKLVLQAENPKYEPLVYIGEELNEIRILGKAISFQSDVV